MCIVLAFMERNWLILLKYEHTSTQAIITFAAVLESTNSPAEKLKSDHVVYSSSVFKDAGYSSGATSRRLGATGAY